MKIEHDEEGVVLKDVFSGVKLVTDEGNCMGICMRDDTFEFSIFKEGVEPKHFIVDYCSMEIKKP